MKGLTQKEKEILAKGGKVTTVTQTGESVTKESGEKEGEVKITVEGGVGFTSRKISEFTGKPIEEVKEEIFREQTGISRQEAISQVVQRGVSKFKDPLSSPEGALRAIKLGVEKRVAEPFSAGVQRGIELTPEAGAMGLVFGVSSKASDILLSQPSVPAKVAGGGIKTALSAEAVFALSKFGREIKEGPIERKAFVTGALIPQFVAGGASFKVTRDLLKVNVPKFKTKVGKFGEVRQEFETKGFKLPSGKEIEILDPKGGDFAGTGTLIRTPSGKVKPIEVAGSGAITNQKFKQAIEGARKGRQAVGFGQDIVRENFLKALGVKKKSKGQLEAQILAFPAEQTPQEVFLGTEQFNVPLILAETKRIQSANKVNLNIGGLVSSQVGQFGKLKESQGTKTSFSKIQKQINITSQKQKLGKINKKKLGSAQGIISFQKAGQVLKESKSIVQKQKRILQQSNVQKIAQKFGVRQALQLRGKQRTTQKISESKRLGIRPFKIKKKRKKLRINKRKGLFVFPSTGVVVRASRRGIGIKIPKQTKKARRGLFKEVRKSGILAKFDPSKLLKGKGKKRRLVL